MTDLTHKVMRRIWFIYIIRQVFRPTLVKLYIAIALLWQTRWFVSWGNVFENASGADTFREVYTFSLSAVSQTELAVQVLGVVVVLLAIWIVFGLRQRNVTNSGFA